MKHLTESLTNRLFFLLITITVSHAAMAQMSQKIIVNNFVSDPEEIEVKLLISDVDGVGPNIKVSIYNEDGRLVFEMFETLPAFGKFAFIPSQFQQKFQHGFNQKPIFNGSIVVESQGGNIIGQFWQMHKKNESRTMTLAIPAGDGSGHEKLTCQHFVSDKNIDSKLIITNVEGIRPVIVMVKYYADAGGLNASERLTIQPNSVQSIDVYKSNKGIKLTGTAYIEVVGNGNVTGEYHQKSEKEKYQIILPLLGVNKIR